MGTHTLHVPPLQARCHRCAPLPSCYQVPRVLRLVKMLRLLKLLRMARLTKLPALMSKVEWLLNRPMVQLGTLCAVCCLMLHVIACLWYWVATLGSDGGWVVSSGLVSAWVASAHNALSCEHSTTGRHPVQGQQDTDCVTSRFCCWGKDRHELQLQTNAHVRTHQRPRGLCACRGTRVTATSMSRPSTLRCLHWQQSASVSGCCRTNSALKRWRPSWRLG